MNNSIFQRIPPLTMTEPEYRSHPAISRSELWKIRESPEKFKWYKDHPSAPTEALLFGQYIHALLLEPDKVGQQFAIMPDLNLRTKDGRAERDALIAKCSAAGVTVIDREMAYLAANMVAVCRADDEVMALLDGVHEQPFLWVDDLTGEPCKCRTDILTIVDGELTIVDYKTTNNASTHKFVRDMYSYGYGLQAGMYCTGVKEAMGLTKLPRFIFIAQEKKPPYSINRIELPEDIILYGVDLFRQYLGTYHDCKEMDWWPGYCGFSGLANEAYMLEYLKDGDDGE